MSNRRGPICPRLLSCARGAFAVLAVFAVPAAIRAQASQSSGLPEAPAKPVLHARQVVPPEQMAMVNHRPYKPPTQADLLHDYVHDTYGFQGGASTSVRAVYGEARGKPSGWGQDFPGFSQRFGSAAGVTAINGTVRYGMEEVFHEDLRFIPCHGCSAKHKIENVLLSEITARHENDGHRVFSLTPTIADFSGPIIAHTIWYPGASVGPEAGAVSARVVFASRVGVHLFREFVLERKHKDEPE